MLSGVWNRELTVTPSSTDPVRVASTKRSNYALQKQLSHGRGMASIVHSLAAYGTSIGIT